jgi:hypothetical protein
MSEHMENPVLGDEREMQELSRLREKLFEIAEAAIQIGLFESDIAHEMQRVAIEVDARGK